MSRQESNFSRGQVAITTGQRVAAGAVFIFVVVVFVVLFAGARGWLDMGRLFGICGFKQVYGLPCPTCYVTTSAMAFVQGRILDSFYIQPAGAVLCCVLLVVGVTALLISVFRVNFGFLHRPWRWRTIKYFVAGALIVLAAGWAVTLARALAQNSGL